MWTRCSDPSWIKYHFLGKATRYIPAAFQLLSNFLSGWPVGPFVTISLSTGWISSCLEIPTWYSGFTEPLAVHGRFHVLCLRFGFVLVPPFTGSLSPNNSLVPTWPILSLSFLYRCQTASQSGGSDWLWLSPLYSSVTSSPYTSLFLIPSWRFLLFGCELTVVSVLSMFFASEVAQL